MGETNGSAGVGSDTALVRLEGSPAGGDFVILCDHASNRVPAGFGEPGLGEEDMRRHIAWDPGALPVARMLARLLGAPLLYPDASRLLIDCNRPIDAPDSVTVRSEDTSIPGNADLPADLRARRISGIYEPYHAAIDALLDERARAGAQSVLVAVHSFTPVYRGRPRPWHLGILYGRDRRIADSLFATYRGEPETVIGDNEPYGPWDGVYHTLERHGEARGLPCVMLEIRNDLIATAPDQERWANSLAAALSAARRDLDMPAVAAGER
ncbi:putative N-formylglutamate amidohydrolase [Tepidamorphus gemmatus]|jgi:predicted N-formylglutamate amidohydrolase|uniref:Putative N-formylglutamate amidohydrolase n=1 Tax=Tepidamorphus gemmatus TaxID=747076 RepID=A0A4R3MCJ7_9HYPH|nr:N-formylglutamate amidohydrolase [Tepidamorphus gemmatus]TCT09195.1 putative N-formylglutamate amidohydrolase [Tepidamorphus gemmatus]